MSETCEPKPHVASATSWCTWANKKAYWLFLDATCPVEWNSEYASLPLISSKEIQLFKVPRKLHRKPISLSKQGFDINYRERDFILHGFQVFIRNILILYFLNRYYIFPFRTGEYFRARKYITLSSRAQQDVCPLQKGFYGILALSKIDVTWNQTINTLRLDTCRLLTNLFGTYYRFFLLLTPVTYCRRVLY